MAGTKSRAFAFIMLLLMIVTAVGLGGTRSLANLRDKAEDAFYYSDTTEGIGTAFENQANAGSNLVTVAKRYLPETDDLVEAVDFAALDLKYASSITDKKAASDELSVSMEQLIAKLESRSDLSGEDMRYVSNFKNDLQNVKQVIKIDPYNEKAQEYNNALGKMPASIFARILGMKELPVMA